jgi:hypothetical protein
LKLIRMGRLATREISCSLEVFPMWSDLLLALAWLAIVLVPAIVAYRQPVVSHNGYLDNYMDASATDATATGSAPDSGTAL